MTQPPFTFNSKATYPRGSKFSASFQELIKNKVDNGGPHPELLITRPRIQVREATTKGAEIDGSFEVAFPHIFEKYKLPNVKTEAVMNAWHSHPMQFWQNQLNFALWCATAGCGVSLQDHILAADPLVSSLYTFHVYYTTRRILAEMKAPLPGDNPWNAYENPYDRKAYERIADEFGVSVTSNWRVLLPNGGLGTMRQRGHGVARGDDYLGTYNHGVNGFARANGV